RLGHWSFQQAVEQESAHVGSEVVPRVRAVERLVAQREVRDDVAVDGGLEQRPLEPRRIAQVAALDAAGRDPDPGEHVAAEAFDEREALARAGRQRDPQLARGQALEYLPDERQA